MGLPAEDWDAIHMMAERNTRSQDPEIMATADADAVDGAVIDMAMYGIQFAADRRSQEPREDLTSLILATEFGGAPMNDIEFGSFFVQLVTAGNDTTQGMLANGLLALLEHPDQLADLRADPSLMPGAVEEILRYENPLHYFRRTATADTELNGQPIAAGDKVAMIYTSANRDEDVFVDPQQFDMRRDPNPHLVVRHRRALLPRRAPRAARGCRVLPGALRHVPDDRDHGRAAPDPIEPQQQPQSAAGPTRSLTESMM